jgi:hypothetical protein
MSEHRHQQLLSEQCHQLNLMSIHRHQKLTENTACASAGQMSGRQGGFPAYEQMVN